MADLQSPTIRASFPNIAKPRAANEGATPKYSVSGVLSPETATQRDKERYAALIKACKDALREKFGTKAFLADGVTVSPAYKWPFRDGAEKAHLEGYNEGDKFFNMTSTRKPGMGVAVRNNGRVTIEDTNDASIFYPGCFVQTMVNPYCYDSNGNKGVSLGLNHILFIRDGERLDGSAGSASDAFVNAEIDPDALAFDEAANGGEANDPDALV